MISRALITALGGVQAEEYVRARGMKTRRSWRGIVEMTGESAHSLDSTKNRSSAGSTELTWLSM